MKKNIIFRSLSAVLKYNGGKKSNVLLYTPQMNEQMSLLLKLMDMSAITKTFIHMYISVEIARLYFFIMTDVLEKYPETKYLIFIEDDVMISPDFFQ